MFRRLFGGGQSGVRKAVVIALIGVAVYTILVGADAAVVRAAIMGGIAVFASLVGHRQDGLNTLAVVALLIGLLQTGIWPFLSLNNRKPDLISEE